MSTLETLIAAITATATSEYERDPVPAAIARRCAARVGKPVTKRDADAIAAEFPGLTCRIERRLGWTSLTWWAQPVHYNRERERQEPTPGAAALAELGVPGPNAGRYVIVARVETGATWPEQNVLERDNAWCYRARDERNAERDATLASLGPTKSTLRAIAERVDAIVLMRQELTAYLTEVPEAVATAVATLLK